MKHRRPSACRTLLLSLVGLTLAACGGGGGGGGGGSAPVATSTGIFTDAPVQGLAYACTPSGQNGVTNAAGQFNFVNGDSCTFSIGNISLPPVTAALVITPREIAAVIANSMGAMQNATTITQNLFQFFQSLDSDGDASNGITLPTNLGTAFMVTEPLAVFDQAPAAFETALQTRVAEAIAVPGNNALPLQVVTQAAALQHAAEQAERLLSGTWFLQGANSRDPSNENGELLGTSVTFLPNGTYLFAELSDPDCADDDAPSADSFGGSEYARYSYDALTGDFVVTEIISDSTGGCGLSGLDESGLARLRVLGDDLILDALDTDDLSGDDAAGRARCEDEDGTVVNMGTGTGQTGYTLADETYACRYTLKRAKGTQSLLATTPPPSGNTGSYILESDLVLGIASVLTIEEIGTNTFRYLLTESYGNNGAPDSEGASDGTARGTFTRNAVSGVITVNEVLNTIGGDGGLCEEDPEEAGSCQKEVTLIVEQDDGNLAFEETRIAEEGSLFEATYVRLPLAARITASQLVGSYFPASFNEEDIELFQFEEPFPSFLNIFDNGDFLLGTYENDSACEVDDEDRPNGNGIEFGTFTVDAVTGEARFSIPSMPAFKRYVDTNGECGLVHKNGVSDRIFLHALDPEVDGEGFLLVFVDDEGTDSVPTLNGELENELAAASSARTIEDGMAIAARANPETDDRGFLVLRPVDSQANTSINDGLHGSWKLTTSTNMDDNVMGAIVPLVVTLNSNNFFVSAGTIGTDAAIDGIEVGTFSINESNQFCVDTVEVDTATNGGLVDITFMEQTCNGVFTLAQDLKTFTLTFGPDNEGEADEVLTFTRISKPYAIPE